VETIAQPNFLAVNADVPEEDVYLFTKTIYENLGFLCNIHPATCDMELENALAGLPLPLHAGPRASTRKPGSISPTHRADATDRHPQRFAPAPVRSGKGAPPGAP
jgi:uncharacterized protein